MRSKKEILIRTVVIFILSALAFSIDFYAPNRVIFRFPNWSEACVVMLAVILSLDKRPITQAEKILAFVYGIFLLIGRGMFAQEWDTRIPFDNGGHIIQWMIAFPGFFLTSLFIIHAVFGYLLRWEPKERCAQSFVEQHLFLSTFLFLLLLQLPSFISCFPGIMIPGDNFRQIVQFFETTVRNIPSITTHHPVVHTLLLGEMIWLGKVLLGSETLGYGIYTAIQILICLLIYARAVSFLHENGVSFAACIGMAAFLGMTPLLSNMLVTSTKDVLYSAFLLLFIIQVFKAINNHVSFIGLFLSSMLTMLFRNEGIYVILITLVCLFFVSRQKKICLYTTLLVMIFNIVLGIVIYPFFKIEKGSWREVLSVPMQTMAKYIIGHKGDWSEQDKEVIETVLDMNNTEEWYSDNTVDSIKIISESNCKLNLEPTDVLRFLIVWIKLGFRHPLTYVDGFLEFKNQLLYPTKCSWITERYDNGLTTYTSQFTFDSLHVVGLNIHYPEKMNRFRNWFDIYRSVIYTVPVIRLFCISATYVWIMLANCFFFASRGCKKNIPLSVLLFILTLIGFVSPTDGDNVRYIYPLAVVSIFSIMLNMILMRKYGPK